jgi:hypothetical protein
MYRFQIQLSLLQHGAGAAAPLPGGVLHVETSVET